MSDIPLVSNPIGWALLQISGGWRRLFMLIGIYAGGMLVVGTLIYRGAQPDLPLSQFASGGMMVVTFLQAGMFFLVAPNLIRKAILRDFTTDMITSHRLTAMSGYTAVLGYASGATAQIFALTFVNWIACNVFAVMSGIGPSQSAAAPTIMFAVLLILSLMSWTLAVLIALSTKGKAAIMGLLVTLGIGSNLTLIAVLPGLDLLLVVVRVSQLVQARAQPIDQLSIFVSILFQMAFTLFFIMAAARKFYRDDVQAFTPLTAQALLALWTLLCAVAIRYWPATIDSMWIGMNFAADPRNQALVTLSSILLMACLPVAVSARAEARWAERSVKDPRFVPARPRRFYLGAISATLIVFAILALITTPVMFKAFSFEGRVYLDQAYYLPVAFFLALLTMSGVLRYAYSMTPNGLIAAVLVVVLLWALPPFADLALEVLEDRHQMAPKTMLFTVSPIGVWLASIRSIDAPIVPGLITQGGIAAVAMILAGRSKYAGNIGPRAAIAQA